MTSADGERTPLGADEGHRPTVVVVSVWLWTAYLVCHAAACLASFLSPYSGQTLQQGEFNLALLVDAVTLALCQSCG